MKLEVIKQDYFGRGISKIDGKTVFIDKALPGEKINIEVINEKKNYQQIAEELKKNLGLQDGSDFYIFGTTMKGEKKVVVLTKKL